MFAFLIASAALADDHAADHAEHAAEAEHPAGAPDEHAADEHHAAGGHAAEAPRFGLGAQAGFPSTGSPSTAHVWLRAGERSAVAAHIGTVDLQQVLGRLQVEYTAWDTHVGASHVGLFFAGGVEVERHLGGHAAEGGEHAEESGEHAAEAHAKAEEAAEEAHAAEASHGSSALFGPALAVGLEAKLGHLPLVAYLEGGASLLGAPEERWGLHPAGSLGLRWVR